MTRMIRWLARSPAWSFALIFLLSFAIRGYFLSKVPPEDVLPHTRWEMEAVAASVAEHGTFANPYILPTGPTAHLPPIVPGVYGLIYRLLGMGLLAGYAVLLLRIASYSVMYALLPWFAGRLGVGREAGVIGGIGGALIALWPGHGEALTAITLGLLLVAFLRRWTTVRSSLSGSLLLGGAWGVAFHLQPALLLVLLGCMAFELWWCGARRTWTSLLAMVLGVALACVPWGLRNYATFNEVIFIRSNLGLELRMGNHEGAAAAMRVMDMRQEHRHPRINEDEARKLVELGEMAYMREAGREALAWIRSHPGDFARLAASRVLHFWCGPLHRPLTALGILTLTIVAFLGAWRILPTLSVPQRAVLLIPLATYPLIYYVVAYMPRYRQPLDWILLVFAGAEVWRWIQRD
jgi:hypothetical protein